VHSMVLISGKPEISGERGRRKAAVEKNELAV
jgi:hypothetical protein